MTTALAVIGVGVLMAGAVIYIRHVLDAHNKRMTRERLRREIERSANRDRF